MEMQTQFDPTKKKAKAAQIHHSTSKNNASLHNVAQELLPWGNNPFFLLYLHILDSMLPKSIQLVKQTLQHSDNHCLK